MKRFLSTVPVDSSRDKHVEHARRAASVLAFAHCAVKFASACVDQSRVVSSTLFARRSENFSRVSSRDARSVFYPQCLWTALGISMWNMPRRPRPHWLSHDVRGNSPARRWISGASFRQPLSRVRRKKFCARFAARCTTTFHPQHLWIALWISMWNIACSPRRRWLSGRVSNSSPARRAGMIERARQQPRMRSRSDCASRFRSASVSLKARRRRLCTRSSSDCRNVQVCCGVMRRHSSSTQT